MSYRFGNAKNEILDPLDYGTHVVSVLQYGSLCYNHNPLLKRKQVNKKKNTNIILIPTNHLISLVGLTKNVNLMMKDSTIITKDGTNSNEKYIQLKSVDKDKNQSIYQ